MLLQVRAQKSALTKAVRRGSLGRRSSLAGCPAQHGLRRPRVSADVQMSAMMNVWTQTVQEKEELGLLLPAARAQIDKLHADQQKGEAGCLVALFSVVSTEFQGLLKSSLHELEQIRSLGLACMDLQGSILDGEQLYVLILSGAIDIFHAEQAALFVHSVGAPSQQVILLLDTPPDTYNVPRIGDTCSTRSR